jgi:hypothetical protein
MLLNDLGVDRDVEDCTFSVGVSVARLLDHSFMRQHSFRLSVVVQTSLFVQPQVSTGAFGSMRRSSR